jgi:hypothetical protein
VVSFSKWRKPPGVFRLSQYLLHDKSGTNSKKLINRTIKELRQDEQEYEELACGELSGLYYLNNNKSFSFIDTAYWGNGIDGRIKVDPGKTDLDRAIGYTRAMRMTSHYWELGNDKVHLWFSYRHFFAQSEVSDKILNAEITKVKEIFSTIKMIG